MLKLLFITLVGVASAAAPGDQIDSNDRAQINALRAHSSNMSCEYYGDFDKVFDYCGSAGYIENFGEKYCMKFLEYRDEFQDKDWNDDVRKCLQDKLSDFAESQQTYPTCQTISDAGFGSHVDCYVKPNQEDPSISWCNLPFMDMVTVAWIAKGDYWEMISQGIPVLLKCFNPFNSGNLVK